MDLVWFYCGVCEHEFADPFQEEHEGVVYAECECGGQFSREVAPPAVPAEPEPRPETPLEAFGFGGDVGGQ